MWHHIVKVNFASHHTRNHNVCFLFAQDGIVKHNKILCYFISYHNIKLELSDKDISTHTLSLLLKIISNSSNVFCCFFFFVLFCYFSPNRSVQRGKQEMLQNHARIHIHIDKNYCKIIALSFVSNLTFVMTCLHILIMIFGNCLSVHAWTTVAYSLPVLRLTYTTTLWKLVFLANTNQQVIEHITT